MSPTPPSQSPEERLRTALRVFAAAAAMVIITLLLMQIIHRVTDAPPETPEALAEGGRLRAHSSCRPIHFSTWGGL